MDYSAPFDEEKVAMLHSDRDHQLMHKLPNLTSPGRLMIGPKVMSSTSMVGGRPADSTPPGPYQNHGHVGKQPAMQKSASKDSLVTNMLQSVTRFLGGVASSEPVAIEPPNHHQPKHSSQAIGYEEEAFQTDHHHFVPPSYTHH